MSTAARWARAKTASYDNPGPPQETLYPQPEASFAVQDMLRRAVPTAYAQQVIRQDPSLSFADRWRLNQAVLSAAGRTSPGKSVATVGNLIPALAGAGLGYLGAAVAAPLFGWGPHEKKVYGIGAAALGAVMNTYGR